MAEAGDLYRTAILSPTSVAIGCLVRGPFHHADAGRAISGDRDNGSFSQ
jgi:acetoin utilization deacetylase AcuC-like enzyme